MDLVPGEKLLYTEGDWEVYVYPTRPLLWIYYERTLHDKARSLDEAKAIINSRQRIIDQVDASQGGEIKRGDRVHVLGSDIDDEYTFLKISGTGHRVVRSDSGIEFALTPNDKMDLLYANASSDEAFDAFRQPGGAFGQ